VRAGLCVLFTVVACGGRVVVDDGAAGGGDGGSSSTSGTTSAGSSSSSPSACMSIADCTDCVVGCAAPGPCATLYSAAMSNGDASAFTKCFDEAQCGAAPDRLACSDGCKAQHPSGHASLLAYYRCIECIHCPSCQEVGWTRYYGCN
jgi:hypothetical protein